ncbi:amino acid ABC transporter permease [Martelella alba]|uniref:Amino acid ABC transporter permease n=1 Tax=Martelella alba TaxID=2590451 RepID=A0ABY2SML7_9HYPH|nr:amino acid ABC transporter permease [Martelella alba]TKI06596.1 amino acid ABC transporter permease [Martelella alba]
MSIILSYLPLLLAGAGYTLIITLVAMVFGSAIGMLVALMQISAFRALQVIAKTYNSLFRGLPLLIQILYIYFGLPLLTGIRIPALVAGAVAMTLYTGAFMAAIFRAGIESVDRGQLEAGRTIGFSHWQAMRLIVFPQAFWRMIPAVANQFSITLKDTSLLSVIGVAELTMRGQSIYSANFDTIRVLSMVGIIYFIIFFIAERFSFYLEKRFSQ